MDTIVFDWGDTLMRVFPRYDGPMCDWPRVEAVPGVRAALEGLKPSYRLALATNAGESGEARVRAALRRVDLEQYFDAVFTAKELGKRKPDPAFFQTVLDQLDRSPEQAAMVGDDYDNDVLGGKRAGMRAFWFNPGRKTVNGAGPLYDGEFSRMEDLPGLANSRLLPDQAECLAWLAEQQAPENLLRHVRAVASAAYWMAVWLREVGESVDPLLAHRGGLLHDLGKISARGSGRSHGELAGELLLAKGQPELAEIARKHMLFTIFDPAEAPRTWEQKLVFYADKLAEADEIVDLKTRSEALCGRYPQGAAEIRRALPVVEGMEEDISSRLKLTNRELIARLREKARLG